MTGNLKVLCYSDDFLRKFSFVVICITVIVQLLVVAYHWGDTQYSDAGAYIKIAKECYTKGLWYPMSDNIYDSYIWSLGYINILILQLKLFGTIDFNPILNILFQLGILFNIYKIGVRLFSCRIAYVSVILYSCLYSNIMIVLPALTELPFLFVVLTAFNLCLHPTGCNLFIAGILFTLANTIRPLVLLFVFAIIVNFVFFKQIKLKNYFALILGAFLSVLTISFWTKSNTGYYICQASTSGYNMIMAANDKANGGVINIFSNSEDLGWIDNEDSLTYKEKDAIWKKRAIDWIIDNPVSYLGLYFKKLLFLWTDDSWSDRYFKEKSTLGATLNKEGLSINLILEDILPRILKSLFYYFVLCLSLFSIVFLRRECLTPKGILLLLLLIGTAATCIFPSGFRYHHPYLFIIVLWASLGIDALLERFYMCKTNHW